MTYSVEKLCFTTARKFIGNFRLPGARITDQLCASEVHQAGFSTDFYSQDHADVQKVLKLLTDKQQALDSAIDRWAQLEERQQELRSD